MLSPAHARARSLSPAPARSHLHLLALACIRSLEQKHFQELSLIFLAYCRSLLGSDTAEDAMEMEMSEFKDFVDECGLETKAVRYRRSNPVPEQCQT